ncbi:HAMP domain-containing histidine kinase [Bacillus sp. BGMRC 2118]|nr:HAMP domain-containing histidine kinase [Bacillus sp. BGMRC 2118]
MKSLKRRIGFHFSLQFLLTLILVFVIILMLLFILIGYIVQEDMNNNYPVAVLDTIVTDTIIEDNKATIQTQWKKELEANGMWLQILDKDGEIIQEVNTPDNIPKSYSASELLRLRETGEWSEYTIQLQMDTFNKSFLYVLGYKNKALQQVKLWAEAYKDEIGTEIGELEKEIGTTGYLHIVDQSGKVIQAFGQNAINETYNTLEIVERKLFPGDPQTDITVYHDAESEYIWIYYNMNEDAEVNGSSFVRKVTIAVIIVGLLMLVVTIAFTAWHAIRYGQPLLLFISWLERLGQETDGQLLTQKDQRVIFTKKGRIRTKYKLYKEVIQSFYDMALKLEKSRKDRERMEKTKEEWMTGISHDLRTPLSTIKGYGHMLESGQYDWSKQELEDMGKTIREKGTYMLSLVEDFSLVFQLKNNKIPLTLVKIDSNKLVHHKILDFVNDVISHDFHFRFSKESEAELYINGDMNMLNRVLDNLLYNAVKHNPKGTVITVLTKKVNSHVAIIIKDNGVGMSQETLTNLFERYYQGTNTEEKSEGTGLGLSIAKAIVESHQGKIDVVSECHKGTTFTLQFPLVSHDKNETTMHQVKSEQHPIRKDD